MIYHLGIAFKGHEFKIAEGFIVSLSEEGQSLGVEEFGVSVFEGVADD